ncbi:PIG-L deacetylase family protein [Streptomyces sp. NPDC059161]|uniref:PIG-L deacetylase family protein n=1 Tax=unclassified Streptomyces TaxID=2593676 RepID=UPI0036519A3E
MPQILAVSPHLDDAVLSAGARLFELAGQGATVTVTTLFAGVPTPPHSTLAELFHAEWQLGDAPVPLRHLEDHKALGLLGAEPVHGPFLDVIYRTGKDGSWLMDLGGTSREYDTDDEPELAARLADAVTAQVAERQPDLVLTCAAVGEHIDHRRTRDAVLAAVGADVPVQCWEDLPYAHQTAERPYLLRTGGFGTAVAEPASDDAWEAKYRAIEEYRSQHSMLWPSGEDFRLSFDRHAAAHTRSGRRAELFWPVRPGRN